MKKIALLMALVMLVLCLAACGQTDNEPAKNTQPQTTEETTPTEMESATTGTTIPVCVHEYVETVVQDATCTQDGVLQLQCALCEEIVLEGVPAMNHMGSGASCTEASVCIYCGEVDEPAWGHDDVNGYCRNCGIDMAEVPAPTPAPTVDSTEPTE